MRSAFWPANVPREETLEAFVAAFSTLGYSVTEDPSREPGVEKVALYSDRIGTPTHAARQLPNGQWTSKLGKDIDIEHDGLADFPPDCPYGAAAVYLKRRVGAEWNRVHQSAQSAAPS
jgi:hypothetical protein